jgi:DNA-binding response OmpR family regulator
MIDTSPVIAVIHTELVILQKMVELLIEEGYTVFSINIDEKTPTTLIQVQPQLIILDITLVQPARSWSILHTLNHNSKPVHIPTIVLFPTKQILTQNQEFLQKYGCIPLLKPFYLDDLFEIIRRFMNRYDGWHHSSCQRKI